MKKINFNSGVALFTSILTLVTFIIAYNTPPLSGPFCREVMCYQYPYLDIVSRFPRDYYWMLPAMIILVAYIVLMTIVANRSEKKLLGQLTVIFASISASILLVTYFTQLSVIQPSLLKNEIDGISLLSQFNPHGLFIALEELGFLVMSVSFLFAGLAVTAVTKLEKWIKRIFVGSFVLTLFSLITIVIFMGLNKEYAFEVAAITITWFTLIINGLLLFRLFNKENR